jgi:hypothetical protein
MHGLEGAAWGRVGGGWGTQQALRERLKQASWVPCVLSWAVRLVLLVRWECESVCSLRSACST